MSRASWEPGRVIVSAARWIGFFLVWVCSPTADAKQVRHEVKKSSNTWTISVRWADAEGQNHRARYSLPTQEVRRDLDTPLKYRKLVAARYIAKEINRETAHLKGVKVLARATATGQVRVTARGKNRAKLKAGLRLAAAARDAALERYLVDNGYTHLGKKIVPDHARHVLEYADDLAPVVEALGGPTDNPRGFADLALSFVQTIPYEKRARVADLYRRPLSLLGRNKGDCDSKTVLFLALMHQAYPDMALAIVYIPGHAYAAVGMEPNRGDVRLRRKGQTWVGAEPVGPRVSPSGKLGAKSRRRARSGLYRMKVVEQ